jgi:NAD(P)-dependent dehydrogenase (short-subunit alcohol dehydrogenase family)
MNNPFSLQSKVILVTGASSGIGRSCAIVLSKLGAKVIVQGRNEMELKDTLDQMKNQSIHEEIVFDFSNFEEIEEKFKSVLNKFGKIDGLVHCAGISSTTPIRVLNASKMDAFFKINVISGIQLIKLLSKTQYVNEKGASYVLISSIMGHVGEVGKTIYSASKGALLSASKSMALELAPKKIRVNCVSPGVILTPINLNQSYTQTEESLEEISNLHSLGLGKVEDIAHAAAYLLSDAAKWVTGTNIMVDGGYTAK